MSNQLKNLKTKNTKYIFVVGGVISGVGKGVTTSSIGKILQFRGYKVEAIKIDPYVNVDAGTMNPTEHGEVFVLSDGDECDQDMGNYERFLNKDLSRENYMTTGRIYKAVIEKERNLEYKGKCVQVVPHIPMEVISRIKNVAKKNDADVVTIEIGGTVGEYENILFLEAVRMMKLENPNNVAVVMVSYVPIPNKVGEMKTKPTQHAVRSLNSVGIYPDFLIARSEKDLDEKRREKISLFCNVKKENIISAPDIDSIYDIPKNFEKDNFGENLIKTLKLKPVKINNLNYNMKDWLNFFDKSKLKQTVKIAVVGKYFDTGDFVLSDSYISVIEALKYAGYENKVKVDLTWIDSKSFEKEKDKNFKSNLKKLKSFDGVLVPGGFGDTGVEGIINAIKFIRENKIPYFGICYGMQLAIIEFAQNVLNWKDATSRELLKNESSKHVVIDLIESQKDILLKKNFGNSMRLGNYEAVLKDNSLLKNIYKVDNIIERHRHRYEVNNNFRKDLEMSGMIFSALSRDGSLVEAMELNKNLHPFFIGVQYHPEFLARPLKSHPIFTAFVKTCIKK